MIRYTPIKPMSVNRTLPEETWGEGGGEGPFDEGDTKHQG